MDVGERGTEREPQAKPADHWGPYMDKPDYERNWRRNSEFFFRGLEIEVPNQKGPWRDYEQGPAIPTVNVLAETGWDWRPAFSKWFCVIPGGWSSDSP